MQRFNPDLTRHGAAAEHSGTSNTRAYAYDLGSPSGSDVDDIGNLVYPDGHKMDADMDDDLDASLTSQSLNPDGTPKRPMNAFMIFARRRRPQISAENQSMRTGEISKILSREWNSMDPPEKQFYLDQAKQLKDNFNQKYPDYVYRRRPNNSRRRRKTDAAIGPSSELHSTTDDYIADGPDPSPVDADEPAYNVPENYYSATLAEASSDHYVAPHTKENTHPPGEAPIYRLPAEIPYHTSHHGRSPDVALRLPMQAPAGALESTPLYQPYPSSQMQSSYFPGPSGEGGGWSSASRGESTRIQAQTWPGSPGLIHSGEGGRLGYEQQGPSHKWVGAGQSGSSGPSRVHPSYNFPTLTPAQPSVQRSSQENYPSLVPSQPTVVGQQYPAATAMQGISLQGRPNESYDAMTYPSQHAPPPSYLSAPSPGSSPYQPARGVVPSSQHSTSQSRGHPSSTSGSGLDNSQQQHRY
ncbi:hypothetical protein EDD16DRAFT_1805965 [Pisolithus croceorrhizus]|nr:hypothetical protein EDD16DRAFT_1805965 [Pisolithus croceorrhizus]KAI6125941.1 hypothetical protein EV401DRAFT_1885744 [Pisolithus croceorrhizus]KAI6169740.1 hypothetical protein EDD17DRAFT_27351 [Pisolithus thermaeus]